MREYRRDQNAAIAKSQRKVERRLKVMEGLESAVGSLSLSLEVRTGLSGGGNAKAQCTPYKIKHLSLPTREISLTCCLVF